MHAIIEKQVSDAINTIKTQINQKFGTESGTIFKQVVGELAKVKHDDSKEHHKFYKDVAISIYALTNIEDDNWISALADIGLVLDGRHPTFNEIALDEYNNEQEMLEFYASTTEELYQQLIGMSQ